MPSWTDEYREIVEFYWWEPQLIGRSVKDYHRFKTADDMWNSVSTKEVALNHILNIFFALMPLHRIPLLALDEHAVALSSAELEAYQRRQHNATQPDIFIREPARNTAIELKTATKSSLHQLEKYVAFHRAIDDTNKQLRIIMLTPYEPAKVFSDNIQGFDSAHIEYVTLTQFANGLQTLDELNTIEKKLVTGVLDYIQTNFRVGND